VCGLHALDRAPTCPARGGGSLLPLCLRILAICAGAVAENKENRRCFFAMSLVRAGFAVALAVKRTMDLLLSAPSFWIADGDSSCFRASMSAVQKNVKHKPDPRQRKKAEAAN